MMIFMLLLFSSASMASAPARSSTGRVWLISGFNFTTPR